MATLKINNFYIFIVCQLNKQMFIIGFDKLPKCKKYYLRTHVLCSTIYNFVKITCFH